MADKNKQPDAPLTGQMNAHILHYMEGQRDVEHVHAIRLQDPKYGLLIMDDYAPVIGMVQGSVHIMADEEEIALEDIKGFYRLLKNEFILLIQPNEKDERSAVGSSKNR
jgi:hypothetical protein